MLSVGYVYGIIRANLPTAASHFIFDASAFGLYISQQWSPTVGDSKRAADVRLWTTLLIAWPIVVSIIPFQPFLVTVIGLRGNIFFLPLLILGSRLKSSDLRFLAFWVAILNIVALFMGVAEYFQGIEAFFPRNEVTLIIYASKDVAGANAYRIPSLFMSAHAFAGMMVMTIPLLFGAWNQPDQKYIRRYVLLIGMAAAIFGVLLAATRVHFIALALLILVTIFAGRLNAEKRFLWTTALAIAALVALSNERLQRFTTLQDSNMISTRVEGSVNSSFWDILRQYPFGNGIGGGGTSMPYFLQDQVINPVAMENEYAKILAEQGAIGLLIWIAFIAWYVQRRSAFENGPWRTGRLMAWFAGLIYFALGLLGTGLLTAIPQTPLLLLAVGWVSSHPASEPSQCRKRPSSLYQPEGAYAES